MILIAELLGAPFNWAPFTVAALVGTVAYLLGLTVIWSVVLSAAVLVVPFLVLWSLFSLMVRRKRKGSEPYYERAKEYLDNGDFERAIAEYSYAIEVDSLNPFLFRDRAWCHEKSGSLYQAISDLTAIVEMNPRVRREAYLNEVTEKSELLRIINRRARLHLDIGAYELAIADYIMCLNSDPGLRGVPLFTSDFRFELFGAHSSWLDLCEVLCHLGQAFNSLENYDGAVNVFSWAIHFGKEHICLRESYVGRAKAYEAKGNSELAEADYRAAERVQWRTMDYVDNAEKCLDNGNLDMAVEDLTTVIQIDSRNPEHYKRRAAVYYQLNEFELAIADYNKSIEQELRAIRARDMTSASAKNYWMHRLATAYHLRGCTQLCVADYNRAIADFKEALRLDPEHKESRDKLTYAAQIAEQNDCRTLSALGTKSNDNKRALTDPEDYIELARASQAKGDYNLARAYWEIANHITQRRYKE